MRRSVRLALALAVSFVTTGSAAAQVLSPYDAPPPGGPALQPAPAPAPSAPTAQPTPYAPTYPPPTYAAPTYPPPLYAPPPLVVPPPTTCLSVSCGPPRIREVEQPRYGLVIAGAIVLGASWSVNAATAYLADEWRLAVPVAGPFLETQRVDTSSGHEANRMLVGLLVFDGLIQTAGATMLIAGAATRHKVHVYDRPQVSFAPTAGAGSAGVAAFGRF